MENETKLAILLFVLSGIIILGTVVYVQAAKPSTSPVIQESCIVLSQGQGGMNFLLFGDKEKAEHYAKYISSVTPFNEFKDKISFYYNEYKPTCRFYKGIALLCDSAELKIAASSCPHDIILVVEKQATSVRSSAKGNVVSINSNLPDSVVIHELGHAVAHLAEEYINNQAPPIGSKNCVSSCSKFGDSDCFQGCSQTSLSRSIDKGVMRTLDTDDYGEFDTELVRKELTSISDGLLTGLASSSSSTCLDKNYLLVTGSQQQGKIKVLSSELRQGCASNHVVGSDNYTISYPQKETDSQSTNLAEIFTDGLVEENLNGEVLYDEDFALAFQVSDKAQTLNLETPYDKVSIPVPEKGDNLLCKI